MALLGAGLQAERGVLTLLSPHVIISALRDGPNLWSFLQCSAPLFSFTRPAELARLSKLRPYQVNSRLSTTAVTPRVAHAAPRAASRSDALSTLPVSVTVPSSTLMLMCLASRSA